MTTKKIEKVKQMQKVKQSNKTNKVKRITLRYLPNRLTRKDRSKQIQMLSKSRKGYKKGLYISRKPLSSFHSKTSNYIQEARKKYQVDTIDASQELSKKTGCSQASLQKIIQKGEGAYYSSGSRPNQTAQSWGKARLASALVAGKAGAVDYSILINGCKPNSLGRKMAEKARKKYGFGKRKVPKTNV